MCAAGRGAGEVRAPAAGPPGSAAARRSEVSVARLAMGDAPAVRGGSAIRAAGRRTVARSALSTRARARAPGAMLRSRLLRPLAGSGDQAARRASARFTPTQSIHQTGSATSGGL